MRLPDRHIRELLDGLACGGASFALYRLPHAGPCRFVLQASGEAERLADIEALHGKRGFVMAPFRLSAAHPPILIRPEVTASGWEQTGLALESLPARPVASGAGDGGGEIPPCDPARPADREFYAEAFGRFIRPLREKRFRKLVLSRCAPYPLHAGFSLAEAFVRACNSYPRMMVYLCHTPVTGTWMGCTPEILLSGRGREWHTVALAGTMPAAGDGDAPAAWSPKNREEQRCVADYIRDVIRKFGSGCTERGPYTARAGELVHLKTDFRFRLGDPGRLGSLLRELHPTPAVCGLPGKEALRFIDANEGYDRLYYSGFTGWLDPEGETDLYVNLRCMRILRSGALLYAGGGLLASSGMEAEWEETEAKMRTMRSVIDSCRIGK